MADEFRGARDDQRPKEANEVANLIKTESSAIIQMAIFPVSGQHPALVL